MTNRPFSSLRFVAALVLVSAALAPSLLLAQHAEHKPGAAAAPAADSTKRPLTRPGQDAFGAIAEIVQLLQRDPATDWSKVNIEALRQHLIDMNEVTLRSAVVAEHVPDGVRLTVTGSGRTKDAIQRMVTAHRHMLMMEGLVGEVTLLPSGVRWTVTANDPERVNELRGLGFIGIMTLGDHHATHHLQLARGETPTGHEH